MASGDPFILKRLALCLCFCLVLPSSAPPLLAQSQIKLSDADALTLAQKAMQSSDPALQKSALETLNRHRFKRPRISEREYVVYALGILEHRSGNGAAAAKHFGTLERIWPKSIHLLEIQGILGLDALEKGKLPEAEKRLRLAMDSSASPAEKRTYQEGILWACVEQKKPESAVSILESLYPLATDQKPSRQGLIAIFEVQAHLGRLEAAKATRESYLTHYPKDKDLDRVDLGYAKLMGEMGNPKDAAKLFSQIIDRASSTVFADESRLALATLLSEGKLKPRDARIYRQPKDLLWDIREPDREAAFKRRTLLVKLRLQLDNAQWKDALALIEVIRGQKPTDEETQVLLKSKKEALQAHVRELLDQQQLDAVLPLLNAENIQLLSTAQRMLLIRRYTPKGLLAPVLMVIQESPNTEQGDLRQVALEIVDPDAHPEATFKLSEAAHSASALLKRAQAACHLKDWPAMARALTGATPGPARIRMICIYLRRPITPQESLVKRIQEGQGFLKSSRESLSDQEALRILLADQHVQLGDFKSALALYPASAQAAFKGWVALMRATCFLKLGNPTEARKILESSQDIPEFRMERQTLLKGLGPKK